MFEKFKLKRKIKSLEKSVAKGDDQAMYDLAMIYLDGTIIKKEEAKAIELLQQSANRGNIQAKTYLLTNKVTKGAKVVGKAIADLKKIKNSK